MRVQITVDSKRFSEGIARSQLAITAMSKDLMELAATIQRRATPTLTQLQPGTNCRDCEMKPIIYIQKRYSDNPSIRNQLLWLMFAKQRGETYSPTKLNRRKGERHGLVSFTWSSLMEDDTPIFMDSCRNLARRRPSPEKPKPLVSTHNGKPIGWYPRQP